MKKLIITCFLVSSASLVSFAQNSEQATTAPKTATTATAAPAPVRKMPSPEQIAERRAKSEEKQYQLSADQYKGVYQAELEYMQHVQQVHNSGGKLDQAQLTQMNTTKDEKFKKIMTPEQYTKYNASKPKPATAAPARTSAAH